MIVAGNVLYGEDIAVGQWVADKIPGYHITPESCRALGVIVKGRLAAGVIYERFNGVALDVSIAALDGATWASRGTLRALFAYPFEQIGCQVITVACAASNLKSLNLAMKLGFRPEAFIKFAACDGGHLVILQMDRSECRWLGHGTLQKQHTGGT